MKNNDEVYDIMNMENCSDYYPTVFDVCYQLYYKGKVHKILLNQFKKLQSSDAKKYNYVPAEILNKVKSFLS